MHIQFFYSTLHIFYSLVFGLPPLKVHPTVFLNTPRCHKLKERLLATLLSLPQPQIRFPFSSFPDVKFLQTIAHLPLLLLPPRTPHSLCGEGGSGRKFRFLVLQSTWRVALSGCRVPAIRHTSGVGRHPCRGWEDACAVSLRVAFSSDRSTKRQSSNISGFTQIFFRGLPFHRWYRWLESVCRCFLLQGDRTEGRSC